MRNILISLQDRTGRMGHVLVAMAMVAGLVGVPVALSLVSTVPASAVAAAPMAPPGACGHVQLAGSARLGGHGVDVKSNGPDQGSGTSCGGMKNTPARSPNTTSPGITVASPMRTGTLIPVTIALIAIVTLMAVCVAVLEQRVRGVDVVA